MTWQFSDMTSSLFLGFVVFFLSSFITVPSFMSLSWPVLELWQFSFIKDWPEIRKSEIPPSKFCPVSGDRGKLVILNSARRSQIKCYCQGVCVRVRARVCVCVCARARACVYAYTLPPWRLFPTAKYLRHTWGVRVNDVMLWVSFQVLLPSSFISISKYVIFHLR